MFMIVNLMGNRGVFTLHGFLGQQYALSLSFQLPLGTGGMKEPPRCNLLDRYTIKQNLERLVLITFPTVH